MKKTTKKIETIAQDTGWVNVNLPVKYLESASQKAYRITLPNKLHFWIPKTQCSIYDFTLRVGVNLEWDNYVFYERKTVGGAVDFIENSTLNGNDFALAIQKYEI